MGEAGELWGRGEDQYDQEAHNPSSTSPNLQYDPMWWVSPHLIRQRHIPGDLLPPSEGHQEEELGRKEVRPPRSVPAPCEDMSRSWRRRPQDKALIK